MLVISLPIFNAKNQDLMHMLKENIAKKTRFVMHKFVYKKNERSKISLQGYGHSEFNYK